MTDSHIPRFYCPEGFTNEAITSLSPDASHHAAVVMRLQITDPVALFDGRGNCAQATIVSTNKREVIVKVAANSTHDPEPQPRLALIQGLATGEKLDWSIEKAVEMGVDDLMICQTERSKVKLTSDRALDKLVRWRAIVQSACSQSGRNWLPSVSYCRGLAAAFDWLQQRKGVALICQPGGTPSLKAFDEAFAAPNRVTIGAFVGPESGFSSTELELAKSKGAVAVTFSPFIMRTETAGPAILTLLDAKRNAQIQFC